MATIYYYSSTGNGLYVAREIAARIEAEVHTMHDEACHDDVIGFVFPTYFWGLPRSVESFMQALTITNPQAYIFSVATYGGMVYGINGRVNQILKDKGLSLHYANQIHCVENYILYYKIKDTDALYAHVQESIECIAKDIKTRKHRSASVYTPINHCVQLLYPNQGSDINFQVSSACIGCGACKNVCPVQNIKMLDGKPEFEHHCDHCLGCIHICPQQAIDWKTKTQGKQRYRHRNITRADLDATER